MLKIYFSWNRYGKNNVSVCRIMWNSRLFSGSMFNVVFDYVFMFPMNLGFTGAALATSLSPIVTMSIWTTHYLGKSNQVEFKTKRLSFLSSEVITFTAVMIVAKTNLKFRK